MQHPTKACPFCGFACPPKALRCRGCDRWFPPDRPQGKRVGARRLLGAFLLILLPFFIVAAFRHHERPFPGDSPRADAILLHLMAQRAVMTQLNWPANAVWESLESIRTNPEQGIETGWTSDGKQLWTVSGGLIFRDNPSAYHAQPWHVVFRQDGRTIRDLALSVNLDPAFAP